MVSSTAVPDRNGGETPPNLLFAGPARGLLAGFLVLSPVVFWYGLLEPFEACKSALTQLAALAFLALAAASACGQSWAWRWGRLRDLFAGPVGAAVLAGVAAAALSTVFSLSPRTSLQGAADSCAGLGSTVAFAVLFAAGRALCGDARRAEQVLSAAAVGAAVACGYAVVQALGADPVAWEETSAFSGWLRPSGTQGHPNYLAGHVVMSLPVLLWLFVRAVQRRRLLQAAAAAAVTVLAATTVLISLSRAAWLAGTVGAVVLLLGWQAARRRRGFGSDSPPTQSSPTLRVGAFSSQHGVSGYTGGSPPTRRWLFALLLVGVVILVGVSIPDSRLKAAVARRLQQQGASPGRRVIWREAYALFRRYPWTGSGLDTFALAYALHRTPEYWEVEWGLMPARAHNDFLHALATQGLPGGAAYLMLPGALLLAAVRRWRSAQERRWVAVLAAAIAAYYVQNLFGFSVASTSALLAVIAAALAGPARRPEAEPNVEAPSTGLLLGAGLAIILVLAGLWQGRQEGQAGRFVLTTGTLAGSAALALAACGMRFPTSWTLRRFNISSLHTYRPVAVPALLAGVGAWQLLCPLAASSLSYRADVSLHACTDDALALHRRAVQLAPGHALLHARMGNALLRAAGLQADPARRQRLLRESANCLEAACRLQPLAAGLHADRAGALLELARQGLVDKDAVLAAFDRALALDRCHWGVLADAARAATTLGRFDAAERYLAEGLAWQPRLGMLQAEKGALELARGRLAEAEAALCHGQGLEWHGDVERYDRAQLLLGLVLLQRGRSADALHVSGEVLKRHDWVPAWWLHALARERLGQRALALQEFRHVLARQPDHPQALAGVERLSRSAGAERTR